MKRRYLTSVPDTMHSKVQNRKNAIETATPALLVTPAETARLLSLAPRTIYALVEAGTLPCVRFGRSVRIPRKAVLALAAGETP